MSDFAFIRRMATPAEGPSTSLPSQRSLLMLLAVTVLALAFSGSCKRSPGGARSGPPPVAAVTTARALLKDVPIELRAVGNVEAFTTIDVRAQVGGQLTEVYFREGDFVRKGDPLFLIDPRPYDEAIRQLEANLARDRALLGQAEANLQLAIAQQKFALDQAERHRKLFEEGVISRQLADQVSTDAEVRAEAVRAAQAAIESARAAIRAGEAALANARLQRGYCSIVSPVDGRTGSLAVKPGNLVKANDLTLVTIHQVRPVLVAFAVPEGVLDEIKARMGSDRLPVTARPQAGAETEEGSLSFVDNQVDRTTGTILLKATFANPRMRLWPGQFVSVVLRLATRPNAVVVPAQAIQTGQSGEFVWVVRQDRTVEVRPVSTGMRVDQDVVIERGLEAGEIVVREGHLRLVPGMKVAPPGDSG